MSFVYLMVIINIDVNNTQITHQDLQFSTLLFFVLGLAALLPLVFVFDDAAFRQTSIQIGLASALFWFILAGFAIIFFWDIYYSYIFPAWFRGFMTLNIFLYTGIGLAMWWVAIQFPGPSILIFVILGGIEGVIEHIYGISFLRILEKVPWLKGLNPTQVLIFSFFEYVFYWSLVAWIAFFLFWLGIL